MGPPTCNQKFTSNNKPSPLEYKPPPNVVDYHEVLKLLQSRHVKRTRQDSINEVII